MTILRFDIHTRNRHKSYSTSLAVFCLGPKWDISQLGSAEHFSWNDHQVLDIIIDIHTVQFKPSLCA